MGEWGLPVSTLLLVISIYLGVGAVFAVAFVTRGVGAVDHNAHNAPPGFRVLILPGSAALWPVLAWKWLRAARKEPAP